jgi:hypothetical protein
MGDYSYKTRLSKSGVVLYKNYIYVSSDGCGQNLFSCSLAKPTGPRLFAVGESKRNSNFMKTG